MTRWLVTGGGGQVATHLVRELGDDAVVTSRGELDITSQRSVRAVVESVRPDVIVNAAAYTAVDAAESDEATAHAVNADGVGHLAHAARSVGARMLHVSTDYVFDGTRAGRPYDVDDATAPRTAYGRTKLAGERLAVEFGAAVVRTAWVYGGPTANFVDTMLDLARTRSYLDVVDDQIGSPTYAADLADGLIELGNLPGQLPPVLHLVNTGTASWFDLAREVFAAADLDPSRIRPVGSAQFERPAPRPAWSVLSLDSWLAAGLTEPRPWAEGVRSYVQRCAAGL